MVQLLELIEVREYAFDILSLFQVVFLNLSFIYFYIVAVCQVFNFYFQILRAWNFYKVCYKTSTSCFPPSPPSGSYILSLPLLWVKSWFWWSICERCWKVHSWEVTCLMSLVYHHTSLVIRLVIEFSAKNTFSLDFEDFGPLASSFQQFSCEVQNHSDFNPLMWLVFSLWKLCWVFSLFPVSWNFRKVMSLCGLFFHSLCWDFVMWEFMSFKWRAFFFSFYFYFILVYSWLTILC